MHLHSGVFLVVFSTNSKLGILDLNSEQTVYKSYLYFKQSTRFMLMFMQNLFDWLSDLTVIQTALTLARKWNRALVLRHTISFVEFLVYSAFYFWLLFEFQEILWATLRYAIYLSVMVCSYNAPVLACLYSSVAAHFNNYQVFR